MEDIMGFAVDTMKLCLDNPERFRIVCREEETSTNTAVKEKAREGEEEGYLLIAERQTAGRGRLGRTFESPEQTGLYMSLLLRPDCEPKKALHITTAAAVAVAEAIRELTGRKAEIKWVNDVYVDGRKVCGILTESALDAGSGRMAYAVLGIGVNVTEPKEGFARTIAHIAGALYDFGQEPEAFREKLAAEICNRFLALYPDMHSVRLAERYRALFDCFRKEAKKGYLKDVVLWGISDRFTWKNNFPAPGRTDAPLLFDTGCRPKPAFDALVRN